MRNVQAKLMQRYFRKTIAHPEGSIAHHGDCDFFSVFLCSCGLLADLMSTASEKASELFPPFGAQMADHDATRTFLLRRHVPKYPAPKKRKK